MDKRIIIGATAAAVAIIMGAVAFTQWTRIKAAASVAKSATMNEEQVTEKSDENAQITQEMQEQFQLPDIQLTPEMREAIANGEMTFEEAAAQLLSGGTQAEAAESGEASEADAPATDAEAPSAEEPEAPSATEPETAPAEEPQPIAEASQPAQPIAETPQPAQTVTETPKPSEETEMASLSGMTEEDAEAEQAAEAKKAEEERKAAEAKKAAEAQKAEEERKAAEAKKAEEERKAAEAKKAEEDRKAAEAKKAEEEKTAKTQNLLTQLYVLRDSFNARIDGLINECIEEFLALEPSKQTKVAKIRIVYARMDAVEAMEAECDAQVEAIAAQLDEIDPALGEKARQYYKNEKELKKASLISQYGG